MPSDELTISSASNEEHFDDVAQYEDKYEAACAASIHQLDDLHLGQMARMTLAEQTAEHGDCTCAWPYVIHQLDDLHLG